VRFLSAIRLLIWIRALEWGPWLWQSNTLTTGYSRFYQFCDAIEVCTCSVLTNYSHVHRTSKPAQKTCPDRTVWAYGKHWTDMRNGSNTHICQGVSPSRESRNKADQPACKAYGYWEDEHSVECFNTHNESSPMYTDTSPRNTFFRTWLWFCCNEPFFYWQTYVFNPDMPSTSLTKKQRRAVVGIHARIAHDQRRFLSAAMPAVLPRGQRPHLWQREGQDCRRCQPLDGRMVDEEHHATPL
jgi:hypothetical protein